MFSTGALAIGGFGPSRWRRRSVQTARFGVAAGRLADVARTGRVLGHSPAARAREGESNARLRKLAHCGPTGQASITLLHSVSTARLVIGLGVHGDYRRFSGVATTWRLVRLMYVLPQLAAQREIYVPNG